MTLALGPEGELVSARSPLDWSNWHDTHVNGLICVVCRKRVHLCRRPLSGPGLRRESRWVRHNRGEGPADGYGAGPVTYEHEVLKYWVRDWLRYRGYVDAQVEEVASLANGRTRKPDVTATGKNGVRRLAVEVQMHPLPRELAWRRTTDLIEVGYEVLWLTRHCEWVADGRLAAIGVSVALADDDDVDDEDTCIGAESHGSSRPPVCPGGVRAEAREGWLYSSGAGELVQRAEGAGLETFLDGFLSSPGFARLVRDERIAGHWGWATRTDWQAHHRRRARLAEDELHRLRSALGDQERDLASCHRDITRAADVHQRELDSLHESLRDVQAELVARSGECQRAIRKLERTELDLAASENEASELGAFVRQLGEELVTCWLLPRRTLHAVWKRVASRCRVAIPPLSRTPAGRPAR